MPVKRRNAKRLVSAEREYQIWAVLFLAGRDFFDEAKEIGLAVEVDRILPIEAARNAWRRFGARHIAEEPRGRPCWAERELGPPES